MEQRQDYRTRLSGKVYCGCEDGESGTCKISNGIPPFASECKKRHEDALNAEEEKSVTWHNFFSNYAWDAELQKRLASHVKNRKDHLKNII